jgi:hypothetical protein
MRQEHIVLLSGLPWLRLLSLASPLDAAVCAKLAVLTSLTELHVLTFRCCDLAALAASCVALPRLRTLRLSSAHELSHQQTLGVAQRLARSASLRVLELAEFARLPVPLVDVRKAIGPAVEVRWL